MGNPTSPQTASSDASFWGNGAYFNAQANGYGSSMIVWGTEGIFGGYIVISASESQRIQEIPIEQGAGFTAILILLMDGIDVEIEVVDDTSIQYPPTINGGPYLIATPYGSIPMQLTANKANQARKTEGHRTFTFKSYTAINGLH